MLPLTFRQAGYANLQPHEGNYFTMTYAYLLSEEGTGIGDISDFNEYPDAEIIMESQTDGSRPILMSTLDSMEAGDILLVRYLRDLGMSAMDLLDLSLEAETKSISIIAVLDRFSDLELTKIRIMDIEAKIEQESLKER